MGTKTKYSDEEKDHALSTFLANGCNYWRTAKELNIPYPTLRHWVHKSPLISVILQEHKDRFLKTSWAVLTDGMKTLRAKVKDNSIDVNDLIKVINCLVEKQNLLNQQPTAITRTESTKAKTPKASKDTKNILKKKKAQPSQDQSSDRTISIAS